VKILLIDTVCAILAVDVHQNARGSVREGVCIAAGVVAVGRGM
jgi:hypothetical protein